MKLPNFQVIKTDDNRFKLVSDQGHSHYKEAIEMLLQSEMFIRNNLYFINFYRQGLDMMESGYRGLVEMRGYPMSNITWEDRFSPDKYLQVANQELLFLNELLVIELEENGNDNDAIKLDIERLIAVIELVKKVFPEIQTN